MANVTLLGLPQDLERQLTHVLNSEAHSVNRKRYIEDLRRGPKPSVVFISGDDPGYRDVISGVRESHPGLPIVVATRVPEPLQWLDALDAGATDYCGAPFEGIQVRWIMGSVLGGAEDRAAA